MLWKLPLFQHVILQVAMSIYESFLNTRRLYLCKDWACWLAVKRYIANQTQCIVIKEEKLKLTNTVLLLQASVTRFNFHCGLKYFKYTCNNLSNQLQYSVSRAFRFYQVAWCIFIQLPILNVQLFTVLYQRIQTHHANKRKIS